MYVPYFNIKIGNAKIKRVNAIRIVSSRREIADYAYIRIPSKYMNEDNDFGLAIRNNTFKKGTEVKIEIGYNGYSEHQTSFSGYINEIREGSPLEIECIDEAFKLRDKNIAKTWTKEVELQTILGFVAEKAGVKINFDNAPNFNFTEYKIDNASPWAVLHKLKSECGFSAYFRNKILYIGIEKKPALKKTINFDYSRNVAASSLVYRKKADQNIQIRVKAILPNGETVSATAGDSDGAVREFTTYEINSADTIKSFAENKLLELKYDGYQGDFTAWLIPKVLHSEAVKVTDKRNNRVGTYLAESIETTLTNVGGRQRIQLGRSV